MTGQQHQEKGRHKVLAIEGKVSLRVPKLKQKRIATCCLTMTFLMKRKRKGKICIQTTSWNSESFTSVHYRV